MLDALLHNTVNATVVRGGDKTNVIPSRIDLELDGRAAARLHAGRRHGRTARRCSVRIWSWR